MAFAVLSMELRADPSCQDILWRYKFGEQVAPKVARSITKAKRSVAEFKKELGRDGPIRFLLKDADESVKSHAFGFLQEYKKPKPPSKIFSPVKAITHRMTRNRSGGPLVFDFKRSVLDHAALAATFPFRRSRNKKTLSNLVYFPMRMGLGAVGVMSIDRHFDQLLNIKTRWEIEANAEYWNELIRRDWRYRDIKNEIEAALKEGKEPEEEIMKRARQAVYVRSHELSQYFEFVVRDKLTQDWTDVERLEFTLEMRFAADLKKLRGSKLEADESYIKLDHFEDRVRDETMYKLVGLREELMSTYALVDVAMEDASRMDTEDQAQWEAIKKHPYYSKLFAKKSAGLMDEKDLKYLIQEDLHWQSQLQSWEILGLQKRYEEEGEAQDRPLNINDIRSETLAEF